MKQRIIAFVKRHRWLVSAIKSCQQAGGLLVRQNAIRLYLRSHPVRKLQLGAHENILPGWLNSDLYPQSLRSVTLDATKRFPFADHSLDYIFSEHQLEHISYDQGMNMLRECHRVLKPGGMIRIAVPSLDSLLALFGSEWTPLQRQYAEAVMETCYPEAGRANACFVMNAAFVHWGHLFMYDQQTIQQSLERAGFCSVVRCEPGQSSHEHLRNLEFRTGDRDRYETLVVEARAGRGDSAGPSVER